MKLDKNRLEEITELAQLQFSAAEVATIMQLDRSEFEEAMEHGGAVLEAYERGRLMAVAEVRKAVLTQAKQGSSPAQKQMIEIMDKAARDQRRIMSKG